MNSALNSSEQEKTSVEQKFMNLSSFDATKANKPSLLTKQAEQVSSHKSTPSLEESPSLTSTKPSLLAPKSTSDSEQSPSLTSTTPSLLAPKSTSSLEQNSPSNPITPSLLTPSATISDSSVSEPSQIDRPPAQAPLTAVQKAYQSINNITPSIGLTLSSARKARGFDLIEVSDATRIRRDIIVFIETDQFEKAPAPVYTRAYIKKLAEHYEVDFKILVDQYDKRLELERRTTPIEKPHSQKNNNPKAIEPIKIKAELTRHKGKNKLLKPLVITVAVLFILLLVNDCSGGKSATQPKEGKETVSEVATVPSIEMKDLNKYIIKTELKHYKLEIPNTPIK